MQHALNTQGKVATLLAVAFATVCSFAGVKYWDNPAYRAYDVDCYVQDGLVLNYDGIRNAGPDADHDPNATTWKNLGSWGSDYDMTRYSLVSSAWAAGGSTGYWTDKGFVTAGSSIFYKVDQSWTLPESYSVQTLTDATSSGQGGNIGYVICPYYDNAASGADSDIQDGGLWQKNDWSRFAIGIRKTSFTYRTALSSSMYLCAENDIGSRVGVQQDSYQYMTAMMDSKTNAVIFSGIAAPWAEDSNARRSSSAPSSTAWQNGTSGRTKRTFGKGVSILGHYPRTDELFKGTLNSIRLYSKVLSDEEVAWNRVVDEARYFHRRGAIPVTNVVVAVSGIDGIADDHFAIDADGYTFTAPTSRTVEGKRYALGGYTLETWNGSAWVADGEGTHTGNAVAISDASALVRVTWQYSRPAGEGQLAHYDVGDYVTDGLMLFYDGILNQGVNNPHSYDATTWVNLGNGSGDSQDWTLAIKHKVTSGDIGYWADDGYEFKGFSDFQKMGNSFTIPVTHTIQTLIDASIDEQHWTSAQAYVYATAWDKSSLALRTNGDNPKANSFYWVTQSDGSRTYMLNSSGRYDYATAIQDGDAKTATFFAGVTPPASGGLADGFKQYDSALNSASVANIFLGGYNADSHMFTGKFKFFRYYPNKALSPTELAKNRKVDEYRYFGRYVVTNVLVQSTYSYLQGNEKSGPYEVVDSYTFTAPETVTAENGITYAPDGYTVETWNGTDWAGAIRHSGNAYAYTTTAGKVRLTWHWKATYGCRSAADYKIDDLASGAVMHFDGIYNAGIGTHSDTATKWVNIGTAGSNLDASLAGSADDSAWTEYGYNFKGKRKFMTPNDASKYIHIASTYTLQSLVDAPYADNTHADGNYILATGWNTGSIQIRGDQKTTWFLTQQADYGNRPRYTEIGGAYSYTTAILDDAAKTAVVFPGTKAPTSGTAATGYKQFSSMRDSFDWYVHIGGANLSDGQFLRGTLKSIRYYDRVLTEEELARNRNVDSARYFGKLAVTNVVVSINGAETAYKVEGAYTFNAPATVVENGETKRVAGCYIKELVDGEWTTKRWHDGVTSYHYNEATDDGRIVHITWRGPRPGMKLVIR